MESKNDFSNNETKDILDSNPKFSRKYWFVIFIVILALSLLALGWILYYQNSKIAQPSTTSQEIKPDEIVITKLPNGNQLVENKTQGYKFQLPAGWKADGTNRQFYNSSTTEQCKISSAVSFIDSSTTLDSLKYENEKNLLNLGLTVLSKKYEIIKVANYNALKISITTEETGHSTIVDIPIANKLYSYSMYDLSGDNLSCDDYFDQILNTISI